MQRVVVLWLLSWLALASGALLVCGDHRCSVSAFDRSGLGAAHDLRNQSLDHVMAGVTWLGSLFVLVPLTGQGIAIFTGLLVLGFEVEEMLRALL